MVIVDATVLIDYLTFVHEEGVEPTNNAAERALRTAVQWRKIMFSAECRGGTCRTRLLTVTRTCQLQQISVLAYLTAAISCHHHRHLVASLLGNRLPPELLLIRIGHQVRLHREIREFKR